MSVGGGGARQAEMANRKDYKTAARHLVVPFFFLFHDPQINKQIVGMHSIYRTDKLA